MELYLNIRYCGGIGRMKQKLLIAIMSLFMLSTFVACGAERKRNQLEKSLIEVKEVTNNEESIKDFVKRIMSYLFVLMIQIMNLK